MATASMRRLTRSGRKGTALVVNTHHQANTASSYFGAVNGQHELLLASTQGRQNELGKGKGLYFYLDILVPDKAAKLVFQTRLLVSIIDFLRYLPELDSSTAQDASDHLC
jgi:hypothetical protein